MMNEWIISSSILIAAVLLVRWLLRGKISLRLQYALWAVALVRLLLPFQIFTSDFGAGSIAREVNISEPVRQVYVSTNPNRYEREYETAYRQVTEQYQSLSQTADPIVIEKEAAELAQTRLELDLSKILYQLWFAGMAVMAAVIISCNIHLSLQLRRRRWALEVPESLLNVYITEVVPTPCVFGLFRPVIYLTPDAVKDPQVRAHVLEHELTHYRHGDHLWSLLRSVCLVLHWYNPLVWIAAKVSRADAELACDEGALAKLGESQRFDYSRTLIGLTCSSPFSELIITATTMTGSAGSIRERIKLLAQRPRNTVLTITAAVLMVTLIVGCTFAGAPEMTNPVETESTEATNPGVDNDMSYHGTELPIPGDSDVPLSAAFAGEDFQAHHIYEASETEYLTDIAFTATGQLLDLEFGLLHLTDTAGWQMEVLDSFPFLQPGYPFLARVPFWGDTTTYGLRFTDAQGQDRRFAVSISGEDGSLVCTEYSPAELGLMDAGGVLVFPGTEWNMTMEKVLAALHISEYEQLPYRTSIRVAEMEVLGQMAEVTFDFNQYTNHAEPGLSDVSVEFLDTEASNAVYALLIDTLGAFDWETSGMQTFRWNSAVQIAELFSPEIYSEYLRDTQEDPFTDDAASSITWYGRPNLTNSMTFSSNLPRALQLQAIDGLDQTAEVAALFAEGGDPWYLAALLKPYVFTYTDFDQATFFSAGQTSVELTEAEKDLVREVCGKDALQKVRVRMTWEQMDQVLQTYIDPTAFPMDLKKYLFCPETNAYLLVSEEAPALRSPEILSCQQLKEDQVSMIYRFPGEEQLYCAIIQKARDPNHKLRWQVRSNQLLLGSPDNARSLTAQEIAQVRDAFAPNTSPLSCFVLGVYADISGMEQSRFLSYYPAGEEYGEATEEEFQLLKKKYPEDFQNDETIRDMGTPITPIRAGEVRALMDKYTQVNWEDLPQGGFIHYLEETDSYYVYYSDAGLFGFSCTGGWVYDGGAMLCDRDYVLILTEENGHYYIQAHLPAMVMTDTGSHAMLPAE